MGRGEKKKKKKKKNKGGKKKASREVEREGKGQREQKKVGRRRGGELQRQMFLRERPEKRSRLTPRKGKQGEGDGEEADEKGARRRRVLHHPSL